MSEEGYKVPTLFRGSLKKLVLGENPVIGHYTPERSGFCQRKKTAISRLWVQIQNFKFFGTLSQNMLKRLMFIRNTIFFNCIVILYLYLNY